VFFSEKCLFDSINLENKLPIFHKSKTHSKHYRKLIFKLLLDICKMKVKKTIKKARPLIMIKEKFLISTT